MIKGHGRVLGLGVALPVAEETKGEEQSGPRSLHVSGGRVRIPMGATFLSRCREGLLPGNSDENSPMGFLKGGRVG